MHIYFSGIGGVGLGPLAQMALDAGHTVVGSDMAAGLTTDELGALGIQVHVGEQDGAFLRHTHGVTPIDLFVYTAALPGDHPELIAARELDIRSVKRDGLLRQLIQDSNQQLIAVAGTHGKTTTTGMLVWVFRELDIPVSYSVGSQLSFGPSGHFDPSAQYFIYECDEFDRNFLQFYPAVSIVTSVEYDHPDTYPTEQEYFDAFDQFVRQSDRCVIWQQDFGGADTIAGSNTQVHMIDKSAESVRARIDSIALPGRHNRENAYLVLTDCIDGGLDEQKVRAALSTFPGTIRRFERLADNLYSDYGHHPTEIAATLQMARELSNHVVLVYQPHQNIRQHEIHNQYVDEIFEDADDIYWLPTYLSREDPTLEVLSPEQLTTQLSPDKLHLAEFDDALWNEITRHRDAGHLVLCMGAGSIDGWIRKELNR